MNTIWKYKVPCLGAFTLDIPKNHTYLSMQVQNGEPCFWVALNDTEPTRSVKFVVFGTGHEMPEKHKYFPVGTWQEANGGLVWHLFVEVM